MITNRNLRISIYSCTQCVLLEFDIFFCYRLNGRTISDMRQLGMLQQCNMDELIAEDKAKEEKDKEKEKMRKERLEKKRRLQEEEEYEDQKRRKRKRKRQEEGSRRDKHR